MKPLFFACAVALTACIAACGSTPDPLVHDPDGGTSQIGNPDGGQLPLDAATPDGSVDAGPNTCTPNAYVETLPTNTASISDLVSGYSSSKAQDFLLNALSRRYAQGKSNVDKGLAYTKLGNCIDLFLRDKSSAKAVISQISTVVHECGHVADIAASSGSGNTYIIRDDLKFSCTKGDTTTRGGVTFARSRLTGDAYAASRPACAGSFKSGCDFYADVYLDGNPDDTKFDSGDQGFNMLLEEAVQYINSIATGYAFEDQMKGSSVSDRDGILTFMWYVERYLKMAREKYPDAYKLLSQDACWRHGILTVWGRAELYVDKTKNSTSLGIDDEAIEKLMKVPELVNEIDLLRKLDCTP